MQKKFIDYNKNLFTIYVGLTASGYELSEDSQIVENIRKVKLNEDILEYFKKARISSCSVNPYWPRAFLLTVSGMYMSDEFKYADFNEVVSNINSLENIDPHEKNDELFKWLSKLPEVCTKISMAEEFESLWTMYLKKLKLSDEENRTILINSEHKIEKALGVKENEIPRVVLVPNTLQAPQSADFVHKDGIVYIIQSRFDEESVIHEMLHNVFNEKLLSCSEMVCDNLELLKPVYDKMKKYQYAWNYDKSSWSRVFEENFMRAASIYVNSNGKEDFLKKSQEYEGYGFIYVPILAKKFSMEYKSTSNFKEFMQSCLKECKLRINGINLL